MADVNRKGLSRRRFLRGTALMAGAATLAAPRVSRASSTVLRMQSSWPQDSIFHEMAYEYTTRVEEMAGRRLSIDLRPAGSVVSPWEVHEACAEGVLDAAHSTTAWWFGRQPIGALFGSGPTFGGDAATMFAWVQRGGGKELWDELVRDTWGEALLGFLAFAMPNQPFGWFHEPPRVVDDLVGMRYRTVGGITTDMARKMGMTVGRMPPWEAKDAMRHGLLDGMEMNNPTFDRGFGAQDVANHYVLGSYHQTFEMFEIIFNRERFEGLPEEVQAILRYGAEAANTANSATALDRYSRDLLELIEEGGVTVSRTADEILDRQLEAWDEVMADLADHPLATRILESQKAWCERVVFYGLTNAGDMERAYRHHFPDRLIL